MATPLEEQGFELPEGGDNLAIEAAVKTRKAP